MSGWQAVKVDKMRSTRWQRLSLTVPEQACFAVLAMQGLEDMARVLEALHMLAVAELVAEPSLRRALRTAYREFAVISTGDWPHPSMRLIPCRTVQTPVTVCTSGRYMLCESNTKVAPRRNLPVYSVWPPQISWGAPAWA